MLTTLLLSFSFVASVFGSDYAIPEISVEVRIHDDGTVSIDEHLTYRFDGTFSWAQYRLPKEGFREIRNIRISEQGSPYHNENSEEAGTFSVTDEGGSVNIKWHYNAADTSRVFTVSYELTDALTRGPAMAQFFWNYLSSDRDKYTDQLTITISLPEHVDADNMYAWSRIPGDRTTITAENGVFHIQATNISRSESAKIRTLFPVSVFNENLVSVNAPDFTLSKVLEEEEQIQQQAAEKEKREAFYASISEEVTLIISLLSILIFVVLYKKYSTRFSTKTISDTKTLVIPDQNPPALVGRLLSNHMTTGHHLVATIFDLARRGWFIIREEKPDKDDISRWFSADSSKKSEFIISKTDRLPSDDPSSDEQMVIDFVNKQIDSGEIHIHKILSGSLSGTSKWYSKWKREVKKKFDEKNWVDKKSYTGVTLNMVGQFLLMAAAIYILIMGTPVALVALIITGLMTISSFLMVRRTKSGEEIYRRWKAYVKGLKNADKRTLRMETMDRHFIYATAFHMSEKQINTLVESTNESVSHIFPWIIFAPGSTNTPASVASSVSALAASGTSTFSGVSGGSGAMAGSAGGGASASAG